MSTGDELAQVILGDARFQIALEAVSVLSLLEDLPRIDSELPPANVDWSHALLCASALSQIPTEAAADAALRIAQGCFLREFAGDRHRAAATVILERMGNRRSVQLAEQRAWLAADAWTDAPVPLQLDVIRRRLELGIPLPSGERITGNPFQRDFWTAAGDHGWLSVSAPTSAGKSYIVKRWFEARAQLAERFHGVYLVPTRALIEEVGRDLRRDFADDIPVFTVPWAVTSAPRPREIHVVTQERLNVLLSVMRPSRRICSSSTRRRRSPTAPGVCCCRRYWTKQFAAGPGCRCSSPAPRLATPSCCWRVPRPISVRPISAVRW